MLTPREAALHLIEAGYTQSDIVDLIAESGVTTSQTTISRISVGKIAKPNYEVGNALVSLCARLCPSVKQKRSKAA